MTTALGTFDKHSDDQNHGSIATSVATYLGTPIKDESESFLPHTSTKTRASSSLYRSPSGSTESKSRTPAEKAREKRLRDDPMADVLGPLFIMCRRCGSQIKLSPKSTYDPFHWMRHRGRCLKRPKGVVDEMKLSAKDNSRSKSRTSLNTRSKASSRKSYTPPLTPDYDDDGSSYGHIKEESPIPDFSPMPNAAAQVRDPDPVFEDYLSRSRRTSMRDMRPLSPESWQEWSWSQLKPAVWGVGTMDQDDDDDDDDPMQDVEDAEPQLHHDGIPLVSLGDGMYGVKSQDM